MSELGYNESGYSEPGYKARSSADSHVFADPVRFLEGEPDEDDEHELDGTEDDPYPYGWRERWETLPDGSETLRRIPLTCEDLLSPQEGDFVAEDTLHIDVTDNVAGILRRRYNDEPTVAVWKSLKLNIKIPGLTNGPAPDVCVVEGVRDRKRRRTSFRLGKESGRILLAVEVVSKSSVKKDKEDLPPVYAGLGVEEYVVLHGEGDYIDEVFEVRAWRRDAATSEMCPLELDAEGRFHSETTGLLFGTGEQGRGLVIWDAVTGEPQRPTDEELSWQTRRAEQEAEARRQAEQEKQQAEHRAEQEAEARRQAEQENERLRAQLRGRTNARPS